jgi:hypothetical protein
VDFWRVKSSGCEYSHATRSEMLKHSSEKLNSLPKKKAKERQSRRKSKVFRLPLLISHQQKRIFDQSSFTIQMSLGDFLSKIFHGNESRKILLFAADVFSLIFRNKILYAKYVDKNKTS